MQIYSCHAQFMRKSRDFEGAKTLEESITKNNLHGVIFAIRREFKGQQNRGNRTESL